MKDEKDSMLKAFCRPGVAAKCAAGMVRTGMKTRSMRVPAGMSAELRLQSAMRRQSNETGIRPSGYEK